MTSYFPLLIQVLYVAHISSHYFPAANSYLHLSFKTPNSHVQTHTYAVHTHMYIYIIVEKSPNSSHMYDHGFMDNTNRQAVCKSQKNPLSDSQTAEELRWKP